MIGVEVTMERNMLRAGMIAAAFAALLTATPARADTFNKLMYLTFSGPVQIPGVTLAGGTYSFQLADPDSGRNVMAVLSRDRKSFYGFFLTVPASRSKATDDPVATFRETRRGVPPAIRALFYAGEVTGFEFLYPKPQLSAAPTVASMFDLSRPAGAAFTFSALTPSADALTARLLSAFDTDAVDPKVARGSRPRTIARS